MEYYSTHINKLIQQLSHLPGIGAKSAQRLAFHIMNMPKDQVEQLTSAITGAREKVRYCKNCCTLTDQELCPICSNPRRDPTTIMVVENTRDIWRHIKKQESTKAFTMCFTEQSPPCLASGRTIFV